MPSLMHSDHDISLSTNRFLKSSYRFSESGEVCNNGGKLISPFFCSPKIIEIPYIIHYVFQQPELLMAVDLLCHPARDWRDPELRDEKNGFPGSIHLPYFQIHYISARFGSEIGL